MPITTWKDNIFGKLPQEEWLNVGRIVSRPDDPVLPIFGDIKTNNIKEKWRSISETYSIPRIAPVHAFDTEAEVSPRIPIDEHAIEKCLIKIKRPQSERLQELSKSMSFDELFREVMNDGFELADQVATRARVMKNEVLATGKLTMKENNLNISVDYGVPSSHTSMELDMTGDILSQIEAILTTAISCGVTITGMITSSKMLSAIRNNTTVQKVINGTNAVGAVIRNGVFRDFMNSEYGITNIITNDLLYATDKGIDKTTGRTKVQTHRFYPENKITFFATNSDGKVGVGLWGDPPEVLSSGLLKNQTKISEVSPYVYITQEKDFDPATVWTKASTLFMPVLYNPNAIYIATKK